MISNSDDERIVLTLDAGGTSFRFSAICGNKLITQIISLPSHGDDLEKCLANIVSGFTQVKAQCTRAPAAISFAFPGPADYPAGIIISPGNLPAFFGGVPLGPMLEEKFQVPVFINNDGELFAYGEAIAGFLPHVNGLLEKAGNSKRYKNLFGVTLGTGFGGGTVREGRLCTGDNSNASQAWLLHNKVQPQFNAEEGASIRAVRRVYSEEAGIPVDEAPSPQEIDEVVCGQRPGNRAAAVESYRRLGVVVGDSLVTALALVDGLAVIGGGISKGWPLFAPAMMNELNGFYTGPNGRQFRRLPSVAFNLEDEEQLRIFLAGETRVFPVPGSARKISCDSLQRIGVGLSRLGTSEAVAVGAYAFALQKLDAKK